MDTTVIPFKGLRYNVDKVGNITDVIAPPYDVIKSDERIALEAKHPSNIVRLILSQPQSDDTETENQYTRAATLLKQWMTDQTLIRDSSPNYYIYDQSFHAPDGKHYTRRALIGLGKLEPFENRVILPHEKTHAGPKIDRLNLMRACHANLSPIFLIYQDPDGDIEYIMEQHTDGIPPEVDCKEAFGSTHQLWRIDKPESNRKIRNLFATKQLLIADGHHRYETALTFRDEIENSHDQDTLSGYGYMMMNLVRMESSGLAVLAIHRLLSGLTSHQINQATANLTEIFEVLETASLTDLMSKLNTFKGKKPAVGMYTPDNKYRLLVPRSPVPGELDVTLVQETIINKMFRIETLADHISYSAYDSDAVAHVKNGRDRVALLMNPTPVEQVLNVAMEGSVMPQKSTYFYPKMATGLVLNLLNQHPSNQQF